MLEINKIHHYNCLGGLKLLDDNSIDCCVTSPPYWGLRDYGTAIWIGGDPNCNHFRDNHVSDSCTTGHTSSQKEGGIGDSIYKLICKKCGAVRQDEQIGLELTPEEYVSNMIGVFSEVKRALKPQGTLWLNLGDSYIGGGRGNDYCKEGTLNFALKEAGCRIGAPTGKVKGYKPKDLVGIPWMTAFALRANGWYLRQDIIWHKPNPMPESVTDRCTKSHEYIFLMSKSQKYFFDNEAIQEDSVTTGIRTNKKYAGNSDIYAGNHKDPHQGLAIFDIDGSRNKRDVWTVNTKPYSEAHFATFPQELIVDCIKAGCPKGGIVLDPFMGAGTTAVVARKLERNFIGFELNEKYIKIADKRLYEELGMFL